MDFLEWKWILIEISWKFVPKVRNITALVRLMAWRRPGDKPLSEPVMVRLPTHICITRSQWVNPEWVAGLWSLGSPALFFFFFITLRMQQNGCHVADDTFSCIFLGENFSAQNFTDFYPRGCNWPSALIQIMVWWWIANKPLPESCSMSYGVTKPQWVILSYIVFHLWLVFDLLNYYWNITQNLVLNIVIVVLLSSGINALKLIWYSGVLLQHSAVKTQSLFSKIFTKDTA